MTLIINSYRERLAAKSHVIGSSSNPELQVDKAGKRYYHVGSLDQQVHHLQMYVLKNGCIFVITKKVRRDITKEMIQILSNLRNNKSACSTHTQVIKSLNNQVRLRREVNKSTPIFVTRKILKWLKDLSQPYDQHSPVNLRRKGLKVNYASATISAKKSKVKLIGE